MFRTIDFPAYCQLDQMDCGPSCLKMLTEFFGKKYDLEYLRQISFLQRDGASLGGLSEALNKLGIESVGIKVNFQELISEIPLPAIAHGQIKELNVNRYDFNDFNYRANSKAIKSKSISEEIGYINMATVKMEDVSNIFQSFENKKSIIIDLRNYPAFIYKYFSGFINSEKRDFSKIYSPNINYPGKFLLIEDLKTDGNTKAYKGEIILLVNENSISRTEFTIMAFQTADNVITVGNQTAGTDGDVVVFEYMGGYKTAISGNGILYPDGTETQRKGVKIDVHIEPTINGIRQGRDEILEKAIEIAND